MDTHINIRDDMENRLETEVMEDAWMEDILHLLGGKKIDSDHGEGLLFTNAERGQYAWHNQFRSS